MIARLAAAFALAGIVVGLPARAEPLRLQLHVEAVTFGMQSVSIDLTAALDERSYLVEGAMRLTGFVGALVSSDNYIRGLGAISSGGLVPELYEARSRSGDRDRKAVLTFDAGGLALVDVDPPPSEEGRDPVPSEMLRGVRDTASALLDRFLPRPGVDACSGIVRIFDGRRRFDLHLRWGSDDILKPHRLSVYAGPARRCLAQLERVAGYQRDFQERSKGQPQPVYTVWVVPTGEGRLLMPVRLRVETWFGGFTAYLRWAEVDGKPAFGP